MQSSKAKIKNPPVQTSPKTCLNPNNPIVEDISDNQKPNKQPSTSFPPKGNVEEPLEIDIEATSAHNSTPEKEKSTENTAEKENLTARNAKIQTKKISTLRLK